MTPHIQMCFIPGFRVLVRLSGPPEIWRVVRGQLRSRPLVFVEFAARPIGNRGRLKVDLMIRQTREVSQYRIHVLVPVILLSFRMPE
jgi:hypothetical protein